MNFTFDQRTEDIYSVYSEFVETISDWAKNCARNREETAKREYESVLSRQEKIIDAKMERIREAGLHTVYTEEPRLVQLRKEREESLRGAVREIQLMQIDNQEYEREMKIKISRGEAGNREVFLREIKERQDLLEEKKQQCVSLKENQDAKIEAEIRGLLQRELRKTLDQGYKQYIQKKKDPENEKRLFTACPPAELTALTGNLVQTQNEETAFSKGIRMYGYCIWDGKEFCEKADADVVKAYSFMLRDAKIFTPMVMNQNTSVLLPQLFYESVCDRSVTEALKSIVTSFCMTKKDSPVKLYYYKLNADEILPEVYRDANPGMMQMVTEKELGTVLSRLHKKGQGTKKRDSYEVLVLGEFPAIMNPTMKENLEWILKDGPKNGIAVFGRYDRKALCERASDESVDITAIRLNLLSQGYQYQRDGSFLSLLNEKVRLYINSIDDKNWTRLPINVMKHKVPESNEIELPFWIDGEKKSFYEAAGNVCQITGGLGKDREWAVVWLLMQLLQNKKSRTIYYFNLCENSSDYQEDLGREIGMWAAGKIQYAAPENLLQGMQTVLKETGKSKKGADSIWVILSGMEFLGDYEGYTSQEREKIVSLFPKLVAEAARGRLTLVRLGADKVDCDVWGGSIPNGAQIDLSKNLLSTKAGNKKIQMWEKPEPAVLEEFMKTISRLI